MTLKINSLRLALFGLCVAVLWQSTIVRASSWDPTLLVNTEAFQIIDDGDGTSDLTVQFGDTLAETLTFDITLSRFNFSDDLHVDGNLAGSGTLAVEGSANIDGSTFTVDASADRVGIGTLTPETSLEVAGTASGLTVHASNRLTSSGVLAVESGATIGNNALYVVDTAQGPRVGIGVNPTTNSTVFNVRRGATDFTSNLFLVEDSSGNDAFSVSATGDWNGVVGGFRPALSSNETHTVIRPDLNYIGVMSDHQLVWRSVPTGSFFAAGAIDTGLARNAAGVLQVTNGTTGTGDLVVRDLFAKRTASGLTLQASNLLASSGSLAVKGNATIDGTISGSTLNISGLKNCDTIDTNDEGLLACGTDETGGGGSASGNVVLYSPDGTITRFKPASDTDAARGTALVAAQTAASSGAAIYASGSGFLVASSLGKNGIHYTFAGATVYSSGIPTFTDGGSAMSFTVSGGKFEHIGSTNNAVFRMTNASSKMVIEAQSIHQKSSHTSAPAVYFDNGTSVIRLTDHLTVEQYDAYWVVNGTHFLDSYLIDGGNAGSSSNALEITGGTVTVHASHIQSGGPALNLPPVADASPFEVIIRADTIEAESGSGDTVIDYAVGIIEDVDTTHVVIDADRIIGEIQYLDLGASTNNNMRIKGRIEASGDAITVGETGLVLENVTIETDGTNAISASSSQTVTLVGTLKSNKPVHANITLAGGLFYNGTAFSLPADLEVPDEAYDATAWNGSLEVPTKNAVRDKIETIEGGALFSNTGSLLSTFNNIFVNQSGDTMTGALNVRATASGLALHASNLLTSSGVLRVESGATIGNGVFRVDASAGNVGINTTPTADFQVRGRTENASQPIARITEFNGYDIFKAEGDWGMDNVTLTLGDIDGISWQTKLTLDASANQTLTFENGSAGGAVFTSGPSETVINDIGTDYDFRVESDSNINMLFVDGGTNRVGIGTNSPETTLEVVGTASGLALHASNLLTSSGALSVEGATTIGGTSIFNGLAEFNANATFSSTVTLSGGGEFSQAFGGNFEDDSAFYVGDTFNPTTYLNVDTDCNGGVTCGTTLNGTTVFNNDAADFDTIIKGDTATNLFVADAGTDSLQFGTTVAGAIATFNASNIVFNENSADMDFRVESDDDEYNLFSDGGNDRIGIGTATPGAKLEVKGTMSGHTFQVGPIVLFGVNSKIATGSGMEIQFANSGSVIRTIWSTGTAGASATVGVEDSTATSIYSSNPTVTSKTVTDEASITNPRVGPYRALTPEIISVGSNAASGATLTFLIRSSAQ